MRSVIYILLKHCESVLLDEKECILELFYAVNFIVHAG
jgi:hypothetical protein